ncbi:DUF192 domain-containing protein [Camelimonas sp. ID_303_24]
MARQSSARQSSASGARRLLAALTIALSALTALPALAGSGQGPAAALVTPVDATPLKIITAVTTQAFQVEVRDTPEGREVGLMHRRSMPEAQGMLFDFERDAPVAMWMKNTLIPLDMVFIRADGTIARVARQTEPMSTRIIASGEPVRYVLELNGGVTEKLGIQPGDRVKHPAIAGK